MYLLEECSMKADLSQKKYFKKAIVDHLRNKYFCGCRGLAHKYLTIRFYHIITCTLHVVKSRVHKYELFG